MSNDLGDKGRSSFSAQSYHVPKILWWFAVSAAAYFIYQSFWTQAQLEAFYYDPSYHRGRGRSSVPRISSLPPWALRPSSILCACFFSFGAWVANPYRRVVDASKLPKGRFAALFEWLNKQNQPDIIIDSEGIAGPGGIYFSWDEIKVINVKIGNDPRFDRGQYGPTRVLRLYSSDTSSPIAEIPIHGSKPKPRIIIDQIQKFAPPRLARMLDPLL